MPHNFNLSADEQPGNSSNILDSIHPTISIAVGLCGVCVWAYTTFVTVSSLNQQVAELNTRIQDRYQQAIDHSDANFAKMSTQMSALHSMLSEIRDTIRIMQQQQFNARVGRKGGNND